MVAPLFFERGQHFFSVALRAHILEDTRDLALAINGEGSAGYSLYLFAVHILFFDHAEGVGDFFIGIGEQCVRKVVLLFELELRGRSIGGDAQHHQPGLL